jgi:DNA-binding Lrp family transcriptional regulator
VLPLKYLDSLAAKTLPLTRTQVAQTAPLDSIDESILSALGKNPSLSIVRLASQIGLPASTVRYRLDALIKSGIVIGFPCVVAADQLGLHPLRVLVVARGLNATLRRDLFAFANAHRLCTGFVRCLGAWDFELTFDLERLVQGGEIVQEIYDTFGDYIQSISTATELHIWKAHEWPARSDLETTIKAEVGTRPPKKRAK